VGEFEVATGAMRIDFTRKCAKLLISVAERSNSCLKSVLEISVRAVPDTILENQRNALSFLGFTSPGFSLFVDSTTACSFGTVQSEWQTVFN